MGTVTETLAHHRDVDGAVQRGQSQAAARVREHILHIQRQLEGNPRRLAGLPEGA